MSNISKLVFNKWLLKIWSTLFMLTGLFFVLPLYLIEPLMWVWLAYVIVNFKSLDWEFKIEKLPFVFFIWFFLIELLSLFYSSDIKYGLSMLNRYLPIFIISCLVYITSSNSIPIKKNIHFFFTSIFIGILLCVFFVMYSFISDKSLVALLNINVNEAFQEIIGRWMHRSYLAMAISIVLILLYEFVDSKKSFIYWVVTYVSAFLFIWKAGARVPLLYVIVIGVGVVFDFSLRNFNRRIVLFIGGILTVIIITLLINLSEFSILKNAQAVQPEQLIKLDSRFRIWYYVSSVIKNNFIFGIGIGDSKTAILETYHTNRFLLGETLQLNTHNQFLHFWIEAGLLAGLTFFTGIVSTLIAFKNLKVTVRLLYVLVLLMALFVENVMARAAGKQIILFSLILMSTLNNQVVNYSLIENKKKWVLPFSILLTLIIVLFFPYHLFFKINPKDPQTYRYGTHKVLEYDDLPGNIPENITYDTKGVLLDTLTFIELNDEKPYDITLFGKYKTHSGDSIVAEVFAFVSEDYNGEDVFLFTKDELLQYNADTINVKGKWVHLKVGHSCLEGKLVIGLYCGKKKGQMANSLDGKIILVYPKTILIKK